MSTTLTFTVTHRTGNFAKIFSALNRLGLKPLNGNINKSADSKIDSIEMHLKTGNHIGPSTIQRLKEMVPGIVDVQVQSASATAAPPPVAPPPASRPTRSARSTFRAPAAKPSPQPAASQPTSSTPRPVLTDARPQFNDARIDAETKRFAAAYPKDIFATIQSLESAINSSQREFVLTTLGTRIGMYGARKRKSADKERGISHTVQNSLAMQKAQFGRVSPVMAAMMKKKAGKKSAVAQSKSTVLASELDRFLNVSIVGNEIYVASCPHCASTHPSQGTDCYFIAAYIDSFIKDFWKETKHTVKQTKSKATGSSNCVFEISGIKLK